MQYLFLRPMGTSASVSFWREGLRRDRYSDGDNDHGQGGESDIPSAARPAPQSMPEPMQSQPPPQYGSSRSRSFFANLRRGGASANGDDDLLGSDDAAFEDGSAAIQSMLAASAGPESLPHEAQSQQDTAMENFLDDYSLSIQDENSDSGDDSFVEFSAAASQHVLQQQGSSSKPLSVPSLISSVRLLPIRIYARSGSASDRRGVTPTRSGRQHGRMVGQTNNVVHSLLAREVRH